MLTYIYKFNLFYELRILIDILKIIQSVIFDLSYQDFFS